MLLVDDDESHVGRGREQRAACAHDDFGRAAFDEVPLVVALAVAHTGVHDGHGVAEAAAETGDGLRGKRDFRHEHDGAAPLGERALDGLQVHLGLAGTGDAVHEHHTPVARGPGGLDGGDGSLLPSVSCGAAEGAGASCPAGRRARARGPVFHAPHAPSAFHHHSPLGGQRLQRGTHGAELPRQLGHAHVAGVHRGQHLLLLHGVLAGDERVEGRPARDPAIVDLADGRLLDAPAPVAAPHDARTARGGVNRRTHSASGAA